MQSERYVSIGIIRVAVGVAVRECRPAGFGVRANRVATFHAVMFVVRAGQRYAVRVVGNDDDQGIVAVGFRPVGRVSYGLVQFDRVVGGALPIHRVQLFINAGAFGHQVEAVRVFRENIDRFRGHFNQVRLIREVFQNFRILFEFTIHVDVHVVHREEAEQGFIVVGRQHFLTVAGELETRFFKIGDDVLFVFPFRTVGGKRQEELRAAAEDDIRTMVFGEVVGGDRRLFRATTGVGGYRGRCRVRNGGRGYDADTHVFGTFNDLGNRFDFRIIHRIFGAVFIYAHRVDDGFVSRIVSRCRVRGVGDQGVIARCGDKGHVRQVFHGQMTVVSAFVNTLGKDARRFFDLRAHAVADKEDDVFRFFLRLFIDYFVVDVAFERAFGSIGSDSDVDFASLFEADVVDSVRRVVVMDRNYRLFAEVFSGVFAVDGDV